MLSCSGFEADGPDECIKIIDDPIVEAVELGSPLVGDSGIGADRAEETRSQRGVDSFEQLQEQQADRVTLREELIAARIRKFGKPDPRNREAKPFKELDTVSLRW